MTGKNDSCTYEALLNAAQVGMAEQAAEFALAVKESMAASVDSEITGSGDFLGMSDCNYETYYCL